MSSNVTGGHDDAGSTGRHRRRKRPLPSNSAPRGSSITATAAVCALTLTAASATSAGARAGPGKGGMRLHRFGDGQAAVGAVVDGGSTLYSHDGLPNSNTILPSGRTAAAPPQFRATPNSGSGIGDEAFSTSSLAPGFGTKDDTGPLLVSTEDAGIPNTDVGVNNEIGRCAIYPGGVTDDHRQTPQAPQGSAPEKEEQRRKPLWRGIGKARRQSTRRVQSTSGLDAEGAESSPVQGNVGVNAPTADSQGPANNGVQQRSGDASPGLLPPTLAQVPPSSPQPPRHSQPPMHGQGYGWATQDGSGAAAVVAQGDGVDTESGAFGPCGATLGGTTPQQNDMAAGTLAPEEATTSPAGGGPPSTPHPQAIQQGLPPPAGVPPRTAEMVPIDGLASEGRGVSGQTAVAIAMKKIATTLVPDMVQAVKFVAAAGIVYRIVQRLTAVAIRPKKPLQWEEEQAGRAGKIGGGTRGEGVRDALRRARESMLMQAAGLHVPVDVVDSLDEYELEAHKHRRDVLQVAADLVDCDRLDVTFEDIAGMDSVKQSLQEIISEPLDFPPELYPARLIKPCNGILIYGPPGCGKTLLARAVAKQSGAAFISVKASTLMRRVGGSSAAKGGGDGSGRVGGAGGGVGQSSVMVRALFSLAQKIQPCIIFFDEADGLCFKREEGDSGHDREVMTELMQLWDGLSSSGQDRVVVLAATNRPWDLDPAVQVGLPDRKMRKAVLMKALEDVEVEEGFDWRELAVNTEGYSCGDVVELCREAVRGPLREAMERNRRRTARRQNQGFRNPRLQFPQQEEGPQGQRQQPPRRRQRGDWQSDVDSRTSSETIAAVAASAEAAPLPSVRMRPLRMSDVTAAQRKVVPAFWQAEAYRATYDGYMGSLMEHARQNWSR